MSTPMSRPAWPVALLLVLLLTACGDLGVESSARDRSTHAPTGALPDLVGKGLQFAQDTAQDAGFSQLASHDALGRGRSQIDDRGWKICDQVPPAGTHSTDVEVDFGVVKIEESCPAPGQIATSIPSLGATMPALAGRSLTVARSTFGRNASITIADASGRDRFVIIESNWRVCSTDPPAGAPFTEGEPVAIAVVKFEESCP